MSKEINDINNKKEKSSEETLNKIEVDKFNNYINIQQNLLNSLNIDKDSLFKSFILFQNFLSMNNQNNLQNLQNKKEELSPRKLSPNLKNESNKNTISDKEEKIKTNSNEKNENNKIVVNKNAYDEIPIKPSGYNFMELVEKTLAKEENSSSMSNENNNNDLNNNKINLKEFLKSKTIKNNFNNNKNKLMNEYIAKEIEKMPLKNSDQEIEITNKNYITNNNFQQINNINNNEIQNKEKYQNISVKNKIIDTNLNNEIEEPMNEQPFIFHNQLISEIKIDNNNIQKEDLKIINENNNLNNDKLIQQKIKELNSEIIRFKEERNKISKLKLEYEKIQNKLLNDVKQFTIKKEEFEKYRQEELNKIKSERKKILSENKIINNIKFQNQSYAMTIKKDKETIENLKKQILDYQFIFKQKENESKNLMKNRVIKNSKKFSESKKLNELEFDYYTNNNVGNKIIKVCDRNINKHLNEKGGRNCSSTGKINRKYQDYTLNLHNQIMKILIKKIMKII